MVFVGLFDVQGDSPLSPYQQNLLLRNLSELLRFPPAVRCMYSLIKRRSPPFEDRAALVQCLYWFGKALRANPAQDYDLRNSKTIFEILHGQLGIEGAEPSDAALDALEAFEHCSLSCNATNKTAVFGLSLESRSGPVLVGKRVAEYYLSGPLKLTQYTGRGVPSVSGRLSIYSGGRFPIIIHCRLPMTVHRRQLDLPGLLNNNNIIGSALSVIAPHDLHATIAPKLSRDSQGRMCVYTGRELGACGVQPEHE